MADLINDTRILLVDDARTARDIYTRLLTDNGYQIECAESVQDGIKKLAAGAFDIVIIDYFMPQENGDMLCRAIRQDPRLSHISPVLLTATYSDEIIRLSLEAGASDVPRPDVSRERQCRRKPYEQAFRQPRTGVVAGRYRQLHRQAPQQSPGAAIPADRREPDRVVSVPCP